ncbi:MAG TPA: GNAT family N-acetyltransferase [Ferruginibacter sp.]|nr:GNAT family N-acetyltransferase [Ferruginibacter sp.]
MDILETNRLILRQFTFQDTIFIIELLNSPGWLEFIGDRNVKTHKEAKAYLLNGPIKSYAENGFGLGLVKTKNDNTTIGMCGLIKRDELEYPDIGFAFLPGWSGKGYAYEIAEAVMEYAENQLGLPAVLAITTAANNSSIKLLVKLGLKFLKIISFPGKEEELMLFSKSFAREEKE